MGDERVGKWIENKPKRIVFVPGSLSTWWCKLVNIEGDC